MSRTVYDLIGLAAGIAFILALKGLSHPKTARRGNLIGAFGAIASPVPVFLGVTIAGNSSLQAIRGMFARADFWPLFSRTIQYQGSSYTIRAS